MKRILFPSPYSCGKFPLAFYLAAEEYLARNSAEDFLMIWKTGPSVIFGRNQDMEAEVNVP